MCHWAEDPAVDKLLEELKVTIRCIPLDVEPEEGTCIFMGNRVVNESFSPKRTESSERDKVCDKGPFQAPA